MQAMPLIKERLHHLNEASEMLRFLFEDVPSLKCEDLIPKKLDAQMTKTVLEIAKGLLPEAIEKTEDDAFSLFKEESAKLGVKVGDFMMPLRIAITGSKVSPPLIGSIKILGLAEAIKRLDNAIMVF